jgi:hypothetical protein
LKDGPIAKATLFKHGDDFNEHFNKDKDIEEPIQIVTVQCTIDNGIVEFFKKGNSFEITFDKKLYEPPLFVIEDEKK